MINNSDNQDSSWANLDYEEDQSASEYLDFNKVIGEMLLDLPENSKITTAVTCIISEKNMGILRLDWQFFVNKIHSRKYAKWNTILNSDSPFVLACRKPICSSLYVKPVEKIVGYDYEFGKPDCVQYITILSTLKVLL